MSRESQDRDWSKVNPDDPSPAEDYELVIEADGVVRLVNPEHPHHVVVVRGEPGWQQRVLELVRKGETFTVLCFPDLDG